MSRILVIDDDASNRLIIKSRLCDLGFDVALAESGAAGLVEARENAWDLLMVAAGLGAGIDSHEVTRRLKIIPETAKAPILAYSTGSVSTEDLVRSYEAGCHSFVGKHEMPALDQIVRVLLRGKSALDDLTEQNLVLDRQNRRLQEEEQQQADRETSLLDRGEHSLAVRELAASRPDGMLLVDPEGFVRYADRGARDFFGNRVEGRNLGSMAPASGLEAFVRDARTEAREGFRFDLSAIGGRTARSLTASVIPLVSGSGDGETDLKAVLLLDAGRRRIAAEILRIQEAGIPRQQLGALLDAARRIYRPASLVGGSACMSEARESVMRSCAERRPVLCCGADGVGKTHIARTLHYGGELGGPFLAVSCTALEPESLERELFGYVEGAFEGAAGDRPGLFQRAAGGTVMLEEIGELAKALQERMVRLFEDGMVTRVGSDQPEPVDVRVVASCGGSAAGTAIQEALLPALWDQFSACVVELAPLSERREDVAALATHFVNLYGAGQGVCGLTDDALEALGLHDWPGNVAELEDCILRACEACDGGLLSATHLPSSVRDSCAGLPVCDLIPAAPSQRGVAGGSSETLAGAPRSRLGRGRDWDITDEDPISLDHYEMKALMRALDAVGGDKLAAARLLKVGKSTLYRKLKRFDLK
ncbi:MAG: sigma 54-interacting transcriptional regulator [Planctomycetota bacterium]|jgi:DNA-binding NtrC family response regulator|nr:sigma 54-interacting transcriptional regulator [Planctomycetota bacterium]MDP6761332.1 sigma 54-interacting transcriptional regulator [Planctomycetota bacterium]MDP6991043.1 sigma 54-interacting transcriptional regulator [Planctomycetota bacterium]